MKEFTRYYVRLFMFLMPILFLPIVVDSFGMGRNMLIILMSLLGLVIWVVELLINKKDSLRVNRWWWLLLILVLWSWVGWFRMSAGVRMRSITDLTGVGMLTSILVWSFLWLQVTVTEAEKRKQLNWMTASGILTVILSVIIFLIPSAKFPINFPQSNPFISLNSVWSLSGSIMSEIILIFFLLIEWSKRLILKLRGIVEGEYILESIISSFFGVVLLLDIFKIFKNGWVNLDGNTAWVIAVDAFKRFPIWGMGAGNFRAAFDAFRPTAYNMTANWANGFLHSSSGFFNLWTELGIVGILIVFLMLVSVFKYKKNIEWGLLILMILVGLFLPVNILGMMILAWLMSTTNLEIKKFEISLKVGESGLNVAPILLSVVLIGLSIYSGYWISRITLADVYMRNSLLSATKNDGGGTYNGQIKAIGLNSYVADYRKTYSQTNFALASTLLSNKDITDEDKQKASVLVQQSIREAKAAIALDENNPIYWLNLASLYRQLVGVVDGAADWSFQAYQQATAVEPSNPMSKLDLGGLLFAAKRFDEADRVFEQVVTIKPDFANGWYNWAYSAKEMGRLENAVARLTQAVALVPITSGDYEKANGELATWKKELDEATKKAAASQGTVEQKPVETLKTAEPLPTTVPEAAKLDGQVIN